MKLYANGESVVDNVKPLEMLSKKILYSQQILIMSLFGLWPIVHSLCMNEGMIRIKCCLGFSLLGETSPKFYFIIEFFKQGPLWFLTSSLWFLPSSLSLVESFIILSESFIIFAEFFMTLDSQIYLVIYVTCLLTIISFILSLMIDVYIAFFIVNIIVIICPKLINKPIDTVTWQEYFRRLCWCISKDTQFIITLLYIDISHAFLEITSPKLINK